MGEADVGAGGLGPGQPEAEGLILGQTLSFLRMRRCCKVTQSRGGPARSVQFHFSLSPPPALTVRVDVGTLANAGGRWQDSAEQRLSTQR